MSRLRAVLVALVVSCTAIAVLGGQPALGSARTCAGADCPTLNGNWWMNGERFPQHGTPTHLAYYVMTSSSSGPVTFSVHQGAHLPITGNGSVRVDGQPAPAGSVTVRPGGLTVAPGSAMTLPGNHFIEFVAAPDRYARSAVYSYATMTYNGSNGARTRIDTTVQVRQRLPDLRTWLHGSAWPRAGGHRTASFSVVNASDLAAPGVHASLTFSAGFSLDRHRGVRLSGRRARCTGSRHVHCTLPLTLTRHQRVLSVAVHAARHLRVGHRGSLRLVLTPSGYDNLNHLNKTSAQLRVAP